MAGEVTIANALFSHLGDFTYESAALPIVYPETLPADSLVMPYLLADLAFGESESPFIGFRSQRVVRGILQVTIIHERQRGIMVPLRIAVALVDHFPKGLRLGLDGFTVTVSRHASIDPYSSEPDRVRLPVRVPFSAVPI
jgi:hypothetical protein